MLFIYAVSSGNSKIFHLIYIKFYTGVSCIYKNDTTASEVTTDVAKVNEIVKALEMLS